MMTEKQCLADAMMKGAKAELNAMKSYYVRKYISKQTLEHAESKYQEVVDYFNQNYFNQPFIPMKELQK